MNLLAILVAIAAAILSIPALIFFVECVVSLFLPGEKPVSRPEGGSAVVLVPAHDEKEGVGPTVIGVQSQLQEQDRVLVIADNCTDETAERAPTRSLALPNGLGTARLCRLDCYGSEAVASAS